MALSDIQSQIVQEANSQGVPSSIALAVVQHESSFNPNAVGAAGEVGLFQLMPQFFPNASDIGTNISTGISYLKQLYAKYGTWNTALAAYNWGPGHVDSGKSIPSSVLNYVSTVLGIANSNDQSVTTVVAPPVDTSSAAADFSSPTSLDPTVIAPILLGAVGLVALWWAWD